MPSVPGAAHGTHPRQRVGAQCLSMGFPRDGLDTPAVGVQRHLPGAPGLEQCLLLPRAPLPLEGTRQLVSS